METTLEAIILGQLDMHPGYEAVDLYKLVYQAVFGVEHLLVDEREAHRSLNEELTNVTQCLPGERLFELIDPGGMIYRINLRPYKSRGGTLKRLFRALVLTRSEVTGTRANFFSLWNEAKQLAGRLLLPFSLGDLKKLEHTVQNGDLKALHHSESYVRLNHPSYRLMAVKCIESLRVE